MSDAAERWRLLEEVCQAALERPAHEREAFLAEACGTDEELRREAESLLDRDARAREFLATPLGELAANAMTYSPGGTSLPDQSQDLVGRGLWPASARAASRALESRLFRHHQRAGGCLMLLHPLASVVRWIVKRNRAEADLDDELQMFIDMAAADHRTRLLRSSAPSTRC